MIDGTARPPACTGSARPRGPARDRAVALSRAGALLAALGIAVALASCSSARPSDAWTKDPTVAGSPAFQGGDRDPEGVQPIVPAAIPAVSPDDRLREFQVDDPSRNRYAIDPASLAVDRDVVVRYAMVVTSAGGVRNATYEAIQCNLTAYRLIAVEQPDRSWRRASGTVWQPIRRRGGTDVHAELLRALCEGRSAVRKTDDMVRRLVAGGRLPNP